MAERLIQEPFGMKYITWIDRPECRVKGFYLRCLANRAKGDGYLQKLFSVAKYQSESDALHAAKLRRTLWWRRLPKHLKVMRVTNPRKGKIFGKGVWEHWHPHKNGYLYLHIIATWYDDNCKQHKQSFSAHTRGYGEAYKLAYAKRAEMTKGKTS